MFRDRAGRGHWRPASEASSEAQRGTLAVEVNKWLSDIDKQPAESVNVPIWQKELCRLIKQIKALEMGNSQVAQWN